MKPYRIRRIAPNCYNVLRTPDGYWIGPGLGTFRSVAEAMDWIACREYRRTHEARRANAERRAARDKAWAKAWPGA